MITTVVSVITKVSLLHISHHFIMIIMSYGIIRFTPGGHAAITGIINSSGKRALF